jgi:hypothetical protein
MAILGMIGGLVFLVGWIWLIVTGFKAGGALWGILNIFFQPITGLIFCIVKKAGWMQFGIMIAGLVLVVLSGGLTATISR